MARELELAKARALLAQEELYQAELKEFLSNYQRIKCYQLQEIAKAYPDEQVEYYRNRTWASGAFCKDFRQIVYVSKWERFEAGESGLNDVEEDCVPYIDKKSKWYAYLLSKSRIA